MKKLSQRIVKLLSKKTDLTNLLSKSDIFVTMFSTSGILAMCAGLPVIIVDMNSASEFNIYENNDAIWYSRNKLELRKHLNDLLFDRNTEYQKNVKNESRENFLQMLCHGADNNAAARISDIILCDQ